MTLNLNMALIVWLVFSCSGLVTAALSWRLAYIVLNAVIMRNEPQTVINGSKHLLRNQKLLTAGWLLFFTVGAIALFNPEPQSSQPLTLIGFFITWMLIGAVVLWSIMTIGDYLLSRAMWQQEMKHINH